MRPQPPATLLALLLFLGAAACTPDVEPLVVANLPAPGVPEANASALMVVWPGGVPGKGLATGSVRFPDRSEDAAWVVPPWKEARLLVRSGEPLSVLGGARFDASGFLAAVADERGAIAVASSLEVGVAGVTEDDDFALLRYQPGHGFSLVARKGDPAPGYRFVFTQPNSAAAGAILTRGFAVFVTYVGQQVPGSPPGTTISFNGFGNAVAFRATQQPEVGAPFGQAILRWSAAAGLERIAGTGDPGTGTGTTFDFFTFTSVPELSQRGEIVFDAFLAPTATEPQRHSLWLSEPDGALVPLVIAGDPIVNAPGFTVAGNRFFRFDDGVATCYGGIYDASGDITEGLFQKAPGGGIELIVRRGDPLPGPPGATLNFARNFQRRGPPLSSPIPSWACARSSPTATGSRSPRATSAPSASPIPFGSPAIERSTRSSRGWVSPG